MSVSQLAASRLTRPTKARLKMTDTPAAGAAAAGPTQDECGTLDEIEQHWCTQLVAIAHRPRITSENAQPLAFLAFPRASSAVRSLHSPCLATLAQARRALRAVPHKPSPSLGPIRLYPGAFPSRLAHPHSRPAPLPPEPLSPHVL